MAVPREMGDAALVALGLDGGVPRQVASSRCDKRPEATASIVVAVSSTDEGFQSTPVPRQELDRRRYATRSFPPYVGRR